MTILSFRKFRRRFGALFWCLTIFSVLWIFKYMKWIQLKLNGVPQLYAIPGLLLTYWKCWGRIFRGKKIQSTLSICRWLVLGLPPSPMDTNIQGYPGFLYNMAENSAYRWTPAPADSQLWIGNTVYDLRLVESKSIKPTDTEGQLYVYTSYMYICV